MYRKTDGLQCSSRRKYRKATYFFADIGNERTYDDCPHDCIPVEVLQGHGLLRYVARFAGLACVRVNSPRLRVGLPRVARVAGFGCSLALGFTA